MACIAKIVIKNNENKYQIFVFVTNQKEQRNIIQKFKKYCKKSEKLEYFKNWKNWTFSIKDPLLDLDELEKKDWKTTIFSPEEYNEHEHKKETRWSMICHYVGEIISEEGIDNVRGGPYLNTILNKSDLYSLASLDICDKHKVGIKHCHCVFSKNYIDGSTISDPDIVDFCACCSKPCYSRNELIKHESNCY